MGTDTHSRKVRPFGANGSPAPLLIRSVTLPRQLHDERAGVLVRHHLDDRDMAHELLATERVCGAGPSRDLAVASVGEVFLISMQRWRGVESHFNEDTNFDAMVFALMGILVGLVALVIVAVTVLAFVRLDAPASLAFAVRVGLVLMLVSQVVGFQMIVEGGNTFGDRGALKVPHAFTLHAVQVLAGLALLLHQGSGNRRCWLHRVDLLDHGADVLRSKPTRPRHTGINTRPARLGTPGGERRDCVAGGCHARKSAGAGTGSHRRASQPLSPGRTSTLTQNHSGPDKSLTDFAGVVGTAAHAPDGLKSGFAPADGFQAGTARAVNYH